MRPVAIMMAVSPIPPTTQMIAPMPAHVNG
jgi:hypothetical protein